jgi:hypothetical protein
VSENAGLSGNNNMISASPCGISEVVSGNRVIGKLNGDDALQASSLNITAIMNAYFIILK